MKRSRLNRRSKKNSRPWENRELVDAYMERNQRDELRSVLQSCGFYLPAWNPMGRKKYEPHHIFGNRGQRYDLVFNIISVQPSTHDWCHDHKKQSEWRICALWVKLQKDELNLSEFKKATGMNLAGWLDKNKPDGGKLMGYWTELVEHAGKDSE